MERRVRVGPWFWRVLGADLEGLHISQLSGPGPYSREELERTGIFGRSVWSDSVANGYSANVVWKSGNLAV